MRKLILLSGVLLLTGCVVPSIVGSDYTSFPYVQTFQNPATVGHTDVEQRRQDLYACGVEKRYPLDSWDETWRRNARREGEALEQLRERASEIERCMKQKGYMIMSSVDCGPLKKPTGMCN